MILCKRGMSEVPVDITIWDSTGWCDITGELCVGGKRDAKSWVVNEHFIVG